ncbi:MAG: hypothetical protein AAGE89_15915 [Pseudomonadota bacterium]
MSELGAVGTVNPQPQINDAQQKGPPQGVGGLKSLWLNMTGQATSEQSKQLESLKEFVSDKFGDKGVKSFESWKANNVQTATKTGGWSSMISDSDIKNLEATIKSDIEFGPAIESYAKDPIRVTDNLPTARLVLLKHAAKEYSTENPLFVAKFNNMPMTEFMKAPDSFPDNRLNEFPMDKLETTMLDYVTNPNRNNLKFEVNVPYDTRVMAQEALANYQEAKENGDDQQLTEAKRDLISALGKCRKDIVKMMANDTIKRIKTNPEFLAAIKLDLQNAPDPQNGFSDLAPLGDPTSYTMDGLTKSIKDQEIHYHIMNDLEHE